MYYLKLKKQQILLKLTSRFQDIKVSVLFHKEEMNVNNLFTDK